MDKAKVKQFITEMRGKLNALQDALVDTQETDKGGLTSERKRKQPVKYIVVHCSATTAGMDIGAREITDWHKKRGWDTIGYHYVLRRDGIVEQGRYESRKAAHAIGYNSNSIAVCLVGGARKRNGKLVSENNFTKAQMQALLIVLAELCEKYPEAEVLGHRDLKNAKTACPGFDVRSWWAAV